jgi:hypothetical protein
MAHAVDDPIQVLMHVPTHHRAQPLTERQSEQTTPRRRGHATLVWPVVRRWLWPSTASTRC